MKLLLLLAAVCLYFPGLTQDETVKKLRADADKTIKKDPNDTIPRLWRTGGLYSLTVSQASLSNWAAGGDDFSIAINSVLNLYAFYKKGKHSWDNTFDFNLGYVNTTSLGSRKNDDRFDLLSKYGHALNPKLNVGALFNLRSQFFKGYTYPDGTKTFASNFFAPGYLLLSLGLDYKPTKDLSIFFSPATARYVIVRDTALANKGLYGVEPGEKANFEFGAFATVNYLKEFNKNVTYKGRLDLFSNYLRNPQNIDVFLSNVLNVKLAGVLSFVWGVDMIYDDDVRLFGPDQDAPRLQIKSVVGLGLLVKF